MLRKNPAAVALGRRGGKVKSEAKTLACRANARKPRRKRVTLLSKPGAVLTLPAPTPDVIAAVRKALEP